MPLKKTKVPKTACGFYYDGFTYPQQNTFFVLSNNVLLISSSPSSLVAHVNEFRQAGMEDRMHKAEYIKNGPKIYKKGEYIKSQK